MLLIADSGSTKTEWRLIGATGNSRTILTSGINPYYQTTEQILASLESEFGVQETVESIHFYGAGCANAEKNNVVEKALNAFFKTDNVFVKSDLEGAAVALCQHTPGIACILGTGSNSCYFDGQQIVQNVSPLGFILGDEGSGAVLGKKLIADILKRQLPAPVIDLFFAQYTTAPADIIDKVYRQPFPNRYLAQYSKFLKEHIAIPELNKLVIDGFKEFASRNLLQYPQAATTEIHFTGSVAYHFLPQLTEALNCYNLKVGKVCISPMDNLAEYHTQHRTI